MRYNTRNTQTASARSLSAGAVAIAAVCASLITTPVAATDGANSDPVAPDPGETGPAVQDAEGPTIRIGYSRAAFKSNPISSFMYFVPLLSVTAVNRETSASNVQEVGIVSYERDIRSSTFYVACGFEIRGTGFHRNTFEPAEMIERRTRDLEGNEPLEGALEYINFQGEGFGRIEVQGTMLGDTATVTEVNFRFNAGDRQSPVTIGLYDIVPVDGEYKYENRSNAVVARVNTLSFVKTDADPTMGIAVATIKKPGAREGFFARLKGAIANFFIDPPRIEELGNETMLKFGHALLRRDPVFTFPVAPNLERDVLVDPSESSQ